MKIMTIIGIILIVFGVIGLIYGGISYTSSRNAISMGDMHLQVNETKHIPFTPVAGALAVLAGAILIAFDRQRQSQGRTA